MSFKKYAVVFDFSNIDDEVEVDDLSIILEIQPTIGMSIYIDDNALTTKSLYALHPSPNSLL